MSDDLRQEIYNNMNLKDSDELLNIWVTNNRSVWSDSTFEVIGEILKKRNIELPPQDPPILEDLGNSDSKYNPKDFTPEERRIIEDENPPEFYDPFEVLNTSRRMEIMAKVMVGVVILSNAVKYSTTRNIVHAYFVQYPIPLLEFYITISVIMTNIIIGIAVTYFSLVTLSKILRILMEMEFNSRIDK